MNVSAANTPNKIDWSQPNDHGEDSNCLFSHFYADETRGKEFADRGPSVEEFGARIREAVNKGKEIDLTVKFLFNEFKVHSCPDEYHYVLNCTFKELLDNEKDERIENIYKQLWKKFTNIAENSIYTATTGPTENARMNPLVSGCGSCTVQ